MMKRTLRYTYSIGCIVKFLRNQIQLSLTFNKTMHYNWCYMYSAKHFMINNGFASLHTIIRRKKTNRVDCLKFKIHICNFEEQARHKMKDPQTKYPVIKLQLIPNFLLLQTLTTHTYPPLIT